MEEISLRELIEILLKGKWIIAIVTCVSMLVSGIFSFFLVKPTYEAQTTLMISPISNVQSKDTENNQFFGLVGSLSQYPQMTIDTYREQVKTSSVLDKVAKELNTGADWTDISKKISVSNTKNTNILTLSVKDSDPKKAADIANLVSKYFSQFVSQTTQKQAEQAAQFIKEQQDKEKANLDKAMNELKKFLAQPRGPEELKQELESKLKQLTEFKTNINKLTVDEQATKDSLEKAKAILANTSQIIVTNKTLSNDDLLMDVVKDKSGLEASEIAGIGLSNEEVNSIYVRTSAQANELEIKLAQITSEKNITNTQIVERQKEIDLLQAEQAEKQAKYDILNHEVELIEKTYDAYQQKYKEALIKQSAEIGKSSIVTLAQALEPTRPEGPKKAMNIAIGMVLGFMISVMYVFAKEYWIQSGIVSNKNEIAV